MAKRPDGDGTIRKRTDGRWEGIIIIGHKADGKPIRKSVFASTQKELLPKLHQLIEDYRGVDLTEDCSMTLGEWLDTWLDKYSKLNLRTSTTRSYTVSLNHIKQYLGDKQIKRVTTADIQRMYNTLKKKGRVNPDAEMGTTLADSTIRRTHMFLHEALDAAVRERLIARNPTNGTVIPKANYKNYIYNHIIVDIGDLQLDQLTQKHLQDYYERLKLGGRLVRQNVFGDGVSDRMVRGCHAICRKALEKACAVGLIPINPAIGCKIPPKKAREMEILTREEIQRFIIQAAYRQGNQSPRKRNRNSDETRGHTAHKDRLHCIQR